jgi:hypothetical protein
VAGSRIEFLKPWYDFVLGQGEVFLDELRRELSPGHALEKLNLIPLAHSGAADDALFGTEDGRVFQVHLTLSHRAEELPLPRCREYSSAEVWAEEVMQPANRDYLGGL